MKLNNYDLFTGPIQIPSKGNMAKGTNSTKGSMNVSPSMFRPETPKIRDPVGNEARDLRYLIDHTPVRLHLMTTLFTEKPI